MGDEKPEIVMASRDRERDRELLIPVADSPDLDIASKPSSSSASSSHHSGRELKMAEESKPRVRKPVFTKVEQLCPGTFGALKSSRSRHAFLNWNRSLQEPFSFARDL
ncbi:hypothetical protein OIU76_014517 [Salix suchowensis]|nr:hypothetical protein OIU76_014517 [Salix suchowensis]